MEFVDLIQERDRTNCHYYASVERLYPQAGNGCLWGNDRRTKGDVGKAKLFQQGTKCREKKIDKGWNWLPHDLFNVDRAHTGDGNRSQVLLHAVHVKTVTNSSSKQRLISDDQVISQKEKNNVA